MVDCDGVPVVIDNGSGMVKAGFGGDNKPNIVFPSIIGSPNPQSILDGIDLEDCYLGSDAQMKRELLTLKYPIKHGIVTDWDGMEMIWKYTFEDKMEIEPDDHPILLTEAPLNPTENRERMAEIMFETFGVPAMNVGTQAVLSLYASGRTTGVVVDSGDGITHTVPIFDGFLIPHLITRMDLAGRDLTDYLTKIMMQRGYYLSTTAEQDIARDIKEKLCYVALDFVQETHKAETDKQSVEETYTLPNGDVITLGEERFKCPEALFQPALLGRDEVGVHKKLFDSIQKSELDIRKELYNNIILSGGTSLLPGIDERLERELVDLIPDNSSVRVITPDDRQYSVWMGGSILVSLPTFEENWITMDDYNDVGADIVHEKKCY